MKTNQHPNLYKKTNQQTYNKPIRNLIDSLYKSIYKLRKRVIDKEKYIKFLKTSLEECGRDYKKEFKEYKKVLREQTLDPFISASNSAPCTQKAKGKNYLKNKRRRKKIRKVVESPMERQDTIHRTIGEDQVQQEGESSNDGSFHTCIDENEELVNEQETHKPFLLTPQQIYTRNMELIENLVQSRKKQEEFEKMMYLSNIEEEKRLKEATENYLKKIEEYNKSTPAEGINKNIKEEKEELEEICTDSNPQPSSEPGKVVGKDVEKHIEQKLDSYASLPNEESLTEEQIDEMRRNIRTIEDADRVNQIVIRRMMKEESKKRKKVYKDY
jgi:hypothetical protein